jgi:hypothetical protein
MMEVKKLNSFVEDWKTPVKIAFLYRLMVMISGRIRISWVTFSTNKCRSLISMAVVILVLSNKVDGRQRRMSDVVEDSIRISLSVEIDVFRVIKFVYRSGYYGEASFRDLEKCWARKYTSGTCFVRVYELASSYSFNGSIHIETNFGFLLLKLMFLSGEYSET